MRRKLLAGSVSLGALILAFVFDWRSPSAVYARTVSEFVAHPLFDRTVRVQGELVPGSLCMRREPCEYRFRLRARWLSAADRSPGAQRPELAVSYSSCLIPDKLRAAPGRDLTVIVEGQLCADCHRFEASHLFAREDYETQPHKTRAQREQLEPPVLEPSRSFECVSMKP